MTREQELRVDRDEFQHICIERSNIILELRAEIKRLRDSLNEIVEIDHYPDATIARKALGLPVTDRETIERK